MNLKSFIGISSQPLSVEQSRNRNPKFLTYGCHKASKNYAGDLSLKLVIEIPLHIFNTNQKIKQLKEIWEKPRMLLSRMMYGILLAQCLSTRIYIADKEYWLINQLTKRYNDIHVQKQTSSFIPPIMKFTPQMWRLELNRLKEEVFTPSGVSSSSSS